MADKYLKEDASGGYLLEDGSGVLILEALPTPPPPVFVRDFWDRDEWGRFVPGMGFRQV